MTFPIYLGSALTINISVRIGICGRLYICCRLIALAFFQAVHYVSVMRADYSGVSPVSYAAQQFIYLKHLDFDFKINLCLMGHKDTKDMPRIRVVLDYLKNILKNRPN